MAVGASGAMVEIHYPDVRTVADEVATLAENSTVRIERSPSPPLHFNDEAARQYAWLLAQLRAFDSCTAAIAIGGRDNRSAAMLLRLSEGRAKPILPLPSCGGAAATEFHRRRFELEDWLGRVALERLSAGGPDDAEFTISQLEILGERQRHRRTPPRGGDTFFISYARARPAEADHIETILRRRNRLVFRDEAGIEPGHDIPERLRNEIRQASVFIVVWCREYACSPWCFDELELAMEQSKRNALTLWILCVDDTRMVPPGLRSLNYFKVQTRDELEGRLAVLLEQRE